MLASAWCSSRSQLAAHSGFAFERAGSTNILVSGGEGRTAARQNVLVTTDNSKSHLGRTSFGVALRLGRKHGSQQLA